MSTRERLESQRVQARAETGRDVPCPGCACSTLLRPDTGMCERCTAKTPEYRNEWANQRARSIPKAPRKSTRLPPGTCFVCSEPYGELTIRQHDRICSARPYVCECGRRYWTPHDLQGHTYRCRPAMLTEVRTK